MKIPPSAERDVIEAFTVDLMPLQEIADILHVSKQAVRNYLKVRGVDTSKRKIAVSCTTCGAELMRTRKRVRFQKNHFCNMVCYRAFMDTGGHFRENNMAYRITREVVAKYFELQPGHIVHHEDRNQFNNNPHNLRVFATRGDHIRYHHQKRDTYHNTLTSERRAVQDRMGYHGEPVEPIWDGRLA